MALGKMGQNICFDFLRGHPEVVRVEDASELKLLQEGEADALICLRDGDNPLAEIKTDKWLGRTPNVLLEVLRFNHTADPEHAIKLGWAGRSVARYIMYVAISTGYIYQFNKLRLLASFQSWSRLMRKGVRLDFVPTDSIKSTVNVLMPLSECRNAYRVHDALPFFKPYIPNIEQDRLRFASESLTW